jgi:anti-sigma-K factor RskA
MNDQEGQSDLDWLAFCYAAGELSVADAEAFEARLADDQSAREAVARAVELTQIVAAAEAQSGDFVTPAARTTSDWNTRLSWMAIGGLASVLLALLWSGIVGPTWKTAQRGANAASQQTLALAWNETRAQIANVREAGLWPSVGTASTDVEDEVASDFQVDDGSVEEAPSWMMAALFGQATDDAQPAEPFNSERLEN